MPDVRQILTNWQTPAGSGFVTVMYFHADSAVADQRAALAALWTTTQSAITPATSWRIADAGVDMDEATGTLTAAWGSSTVYADTGDSSGNPVPDSSQMLLRWRTNTIIGGRFLQGKSYVPGVSVANTIDGNVLPSLRAGMATALETFLDALVGFGVWHRPSAGGPGELITATSADVWSEFAVLRRRRQ